MKSLKNLIIWVIVAALFSSPLTALGASSYYINISGRQVHVPMKAVVIPKGAAAQCKDGAYSFSQHRSGTCSGHRGVLKWL